MNTFRTLALAACLPAVACAGEPPVAYLASPTGGAYNAGAVYKLVGKHRTEIFSFCGDGICRAGYAPLTNIREMPDGSLVGVTSRGGASIYGTDGGVIFQLQPMPDGSWTERVLMYLCPYYQQCDWFGHPTSIKFIGTNTIEGVTQSDDGSKGVRWRFEATPDGNDWMPIQHW